MYAGTALDGYLEGCEAFVDRNYNFVADDDEPAAPTAAEGRFEIETHDATVASVGVAGGGNCTDASTSLPVGWSLSGFPGERVVSPLSLIDVAVDMLCLCLLLCAVVPLLRWRLASRRKSRYVQLAAGGGSSLELGSVPHTTAALRSALSDGSTQDTESLQLVVLDHHAHQQLVESQRLVGDRLGELTAELRTLQLQSFPPDAKSGDRVTALAARQRTFQAGAALPAPDDEVAVVALETGKSV